MNTLVRTSRQAGPLTALLFALAAVAGVAAYPAAVAAQGSVAGHSPADQTAEVRPVARLVADGRVELGLQVLGSGADRTAERLAELLVRAANTLRGAQEGLRPLQLDAALSVAAGARAEAMAAASDWLEGYDYAPRLARVWDNWVTVGSAYTTAELSDPLAVDRLARALLDGEAQQTALCDLCTHLGVGSARSGGRTYVSVLLAGEAPDERRLSIVEADMADLVNELRGDLGLSVLEYDDGLAEVAGGWSATMGATGNFRHNPDNAAQAPPGWRTLAENIASVQPPTSLSRAVREAFDNLVDSPSHYETMTDPDLNHIGVGIVVDNAGLWVTQLFAIYG